MSNQTLKELRERVAELNKKIDEAPQWGAAVGVMGEELRGVVRTIHVLQIKHLMDSYSMEFEDAVELDSKLHQDPQSVMDAVL